MDEQDAALVKPVVNRQEGWKEQAQKRHFSRSRNGPEHENKEEESDHQPRPLPFGKIDVFA
jgi:hypothetical protein